MFNKTCQICSVAFESKASNAKYCPECRKGVKNWRRQDARKREAAKAKKQGEKKPFPKIRLNKGNRNELLGAAYKHIENKYPQPPLDPVRLEMDRIVDRSVPRPDRNILEKYGEKLETEVASYGVKKETKDGKTHYFLGFLNGENALGTEWMRIEVLTLFGYRIPREKLLKEITYDNPTLVEYAQECEIRNCEIQKARRAWSDIIESTTWVNRLPEEARPFVEEVFMRKVERDNENLAIIRRFDKED